MIRTFLKIYCIIINKWTWCSFTHGAKYNVLSFEALLCNIIWSSKLLPIKKPHRSTFWHKCTENNHQLLHQWENGWMELTELFLLLKRKDIAAHLHCIPHICDISCPEASWWKCDCHILPKILSATASDHVILLTLTLATPESLCLNKEIQLLTLTGTKYWGTERISFHPLTSGPWWCFFPWTCTQWHFYTCLKRLLFGVMAFWDQTAFRRMSNLIMGLFSTECAHCVH